MWVGHSGPTLLKLAFILICDLGRTAALILESSAIHREVQVKNNVKGSGQECPTHTSRDKMPPALSVAGQSRIELKRQGFAEAQLGKILMRRIQQEIAFSRNHGTRHLQHR